MRNKLIFTKCTTFAKIHVKQTAITCPAVSHISNLVGCPSI